MRSARIRHTPLGRFSSSRWGKGGRHNHALFIVARHVRYNQGGLIGGVEFAVRKQLNVDSFWPSPYTAMAFRVCREDSHPRLQGPACDNEYQLVTMSSNIEQSRILEEGSLGF